MDAFAKRDLKIFGILAGSLCLVGVPIGLAVLVVYAFQ